MIALRLVELDNPKSLWKMVDINYLDNVTVKAYLANEAIMFEWKSSNLDLSLVSRVIDTIEDLLDNHSILTIENLENVIRKKNASYYDGVIEFNNYYGQTFYIGKSY